MSLNNRRALNNDRGIAMITTLLVMMLMSALLVGFTAVVMGDQRYRFIDRDRNQAFYAAAAGVEKLTADLGNLFLGQVAPNTSQLTALTVNEAKPQIDHVAFTAPLAATTLPTSALTKCASPNAISYVGSPGYSIRFCAAPSGNPTTTTSAPIKTGPYEGLIALQMPYQLDVSARMSTGGEVHLVRTMEAVAIPVFQFGIFSDVDLAFFAGPNFSFGGRVHTNSNLFLSQGSGATLTMSDKVTAVGSIIRQRMQNNVSIDTAPAHTGTVSVAKAPSVFRTLLRTEGSQVDGIGSANNEPLWHTTSLSSYNSWIRNSRTGAKPLNLALVAVGGSNPDLIRRPVVDEDIDNPALLSERLFMKSSLRILLSDVANDIVTLPTVTTTDPVSLEPGAWPPAGYTGRPIAASAGPVPATTVAAGSTTATVNVTTPGGIPEYFKIPTTFTLVGSTVTSTTVTCNRRTATQLLGCDNVPTHAIGAAVSMVIVSGGASVTVNAVTTNSNTAGSNKTLTFSSTAAFAPNTFWVTTTGASPVSTLVTCTGYNTTVTPQQFTTCTGLGAAPAAGATITNGFKSNSAVGTLGGFLKIERQATDGSWNDVTLEILNYGIGSPSLTGTACVDPSPNAIVRLQRMRDTANNVCTVPTSVGTDYWPNTLYDTRQALLRDTAPAANALYLGGVTHYLTIDVQNLASWFRGVGAYAASSGVNSKLDNGGYTVYFSDRRNNRDTAGRETGETGFEDNVNPSVADGSPNGTLEAGEDVNANNTLQQYGDRATYNATYIAAPPGAAAPLVSTAGHLTTVTRADAQVNRALLFRRALKLVRGNNIIGQGVTGLSIVSENPVYVQGDWNATGATFGGTHAATAVMADAVTLLSNAWNDNTMWTNPYTVGNRNRGTQTWYRLAIISGKGPSFAQPVGTSTDFGTDGGAHNFLRYLENGDQAVNYRGSMATFFYSRQGFGTFKCCATVYGAPTRNYAFDTDFLNPALLPPNTPMFRDLNTVGFAQDLRPGK